MRLSGLDRCTDLSPGALIPKNNPDAAKGAAVGMFTFIAFFGATWLPLPWLYAAEINPLRTRSKANAISTCSNWLWYVMILACPAKVNYQSLLLTCHC